MTAKPVSRNVHATAIVVGTTGLLFVGESGSGKSERAFACLDEAAGRGLFSALVADDQVLVSLRHGIAVAEAPRATSGRIELRGSGIVRLFSLPRAVMHLTVLCVRSGQAPRLPEEGEQYPVGEAGGLPLIRLPRKAVGLAAIAAICPHLLRLGQVPPPFPRGTS